MAVDTRNAHVRGDGNKSEKRPVAPSQEALDAKRLLDDPAFQKAMARMESGIVNLIVATPHDGSPESDAAEREMCRSLRTLKRLPIAMTKMLQGEQLRLADFRPHDPEKTE